MSLSKIGLPAVRTGIIVAREEIIDAMTSLNAIISLTVSSVGPVLLRDLVESNRIIELSRDVIRPFYAAALGAGARMDACGAGGLRLSRASSRGRVLPLALAAGPPDHD